MKTIIKQFMYYKEASKSNSNNHRISINFISKVGLLEDTIFIIICRIYITYI